MGTCCETICKHRIIFLFIQHLAWLPQGCHQGKQKCGLRYVKTAIFALAITELSFHSCNVLRDCHRGVPRANKKWRPGYVKMAIYCNCGSNNLKTIVDRRVHAARHFYRATICKRGLCCHVVSVCLPSVCPSVCHVREWCQNKQTYLGIF